MLSPEFAGICDVPAGPGVIDRAGAEPLGGVKLEAE